VAKLFAATALPVAITNANVAPANAIFFIFKTPVNKRLKFSRHPLDE
jgi:hypothetical protein